MLRKFVTGLIVIPLAAIFIIFAVANRHFVTVSFDPFDASDPSLAISLPLFAVIVLTAITGVLAGGIAVWLRQGKWRRAARRHESDAQRLRHQLAAQAPASQTPALTYVPPSRQTAL
jgi:uncharacterized integral membrane protein